VVKTDYAAAAAEKKAAIAGSITAAASREDAHGAGKADYSQARL
jgi:hypothetical protein